MGQTIGRYFFACRGRIKPKQNEKSEHLFRYSLQADYGARTRHLDLGKVALYQMS